MVDEPLPADLDADQIEAALLRAAVGDYPAEAAVLLLANDGFWPARLRAAGLIVIEPDPVGGQQWARIEWPDIDAAFAAGRLSGRTEQVAVLGVAASLADGHPVDLADLSATLDRRALALVLAALAHAAGSHDQPVPTPSHYGPGARTGLLSLAPWPVSD